VSDTVLQCYDFTAAVKTTALFSAPSIGLAYLNAAGEVMNTATVLKAPLTTSGFAALERAVTVPIGVAQVRITLKAFAPTDLSTAGTVTFGDIGLYAR
jgi:hypothetical protein